jgi:hypothetical protein
MKTTPLTQGVSTLLLLVYILYGFFALPFAGFLLSLAVGLLSYGALESTELAVAFTILTGVVYSLIQRAGAASALMKMNTKEGFVTGNTDGSEKIAKRVERIYKANVEPHGVYASAFVEGFADVGATEVNGQLKAVMKDKPSEESAESKPASATAPSTAGSGIPPPAPPAVAAAVPKAETQGGVGPSQPTITTTTTTQGFRGAPDDGQFKLGVLPEETKGGYHIDTGTTVMNALNALKPDQIQAMSADTQKLIDTQKSLMSMLSSMKPMLQDGKQMMDTFQEMFGNNQMKM